MSFDIRNSSLVHWLAALSGAITIGGLVVQFFGSQTFFSFLIETVPVPRWVFFATFCSAMVFAMLVTQRATQSAESKSQKLAESTRTDAENRINESQNQLATLQAKLDEYESLERLILGVLASGEEIETHNLVNKLSLSFKPNADTMVLLAVASLRNKGMIVAADSVTPKLKLGSN